jgi:hypothetical protein
MKNTKKLFISALIGTVLSACGSAAQTQSAAPETSAGSGSSAPVRISERIQAALDAKSFEAKYTMTVENAMGDPADGKPTEMIAVSETRAGTLSDVVMKSALGGENSGEQRYLLDGDSALYIKGPALALGAPEEAWYRASDRQAQQYSPGILPSSALKDMLKSAASLDAKVHPAGNEQLDGESCAVYLTDKSKGDDEDIKQTKSVLKSLDGVVFKTLLCKDSLPGLIQFTYTGTGRDAAAKPASIEVTVRLSKYNNSAAVVAPKDAKPLLAPGAGAIKPLATRPTATPRSVVAAATAAPAATEAASTSAAAASTGLNNSNDGSFKTDYPMVGKITDFFDLQENQAMINYTSDTPMKDVYTFYRAELTKQGLTERGILTVFSDSTFSCVFDGLPDGRSVVVQVVDNSNGTVNVNVTKRKL